MHNWCDFRRRKRLGFLYLTLTLTSLGAASRLSGAEAPGGHPRDAADIVMVGGQSPQKGLYLLDSAARTIYFHPIPAAISDSLSADVPFGEFTIFVTLPDVRKPTALAYFGGKIYVVDPETAMLKSVDTGNRTIDNLDTGDVLRKPTAIAVSESGEIAIADDRTHSVLRIPPTGEKKLTRYAGLEEPTRLAYDRSDLLVFSRRNGKRSLFVAPADREKLTARPPSGAELSDFALQRGILYVAAADQVAVYSPDTTLLKINFSRADRVVATEEALAVLSRSEKFVRVLPRLAPVQATLEGTAEKNNRGLVQLYQYLHQRRLLATYQVPAPLNLSPPLQKILLSEWILLPSLSGPATERVEMDSETRQIFRDITCDLNRILCGSGIDPAKLLTRRVFPGRVLTMPEVYVEDARNPNPKTPHSVIGRATTTAASTNQAAGAEQPYTLTAELDRLNYIEAIPPNPTIQPGAFVRLENGRVRIAERPSLCISGAKLAQPDSKPVSLMASLVLPLTAESLPPILTQNTGLRDPKKLGITQISATFEGVERRFLETSGILSTLPLGGRCSSAYTNVRTVLVPEVLTVNSGRYRLSVNSVSLLPHIRKSLKSELWGRDVYLSLLTDGIELTVRQAFALGFTAVPLRSGADGKLTAAAPLDPHNVPGRARAGGPSEGAAGTRNARWLLTFLAPARELNDISSSLRKLEEANEDMYIWSSEERLTTVESAVPGNPRALSTDQARAARQTMMSRIDYPPTQPDLSRSAVGVLESSADVNVKHEAFCAGGHWLWIDGLGGTQEPCQEGQAVPAADATAPAARSDHGTHVAAILSTGPQSPIPALLPNARLGLIDISRPTAIQAQMQKAIGEQVIVFNFSGSIQKEAEVAWLPVKRKMRKDWQDRLFVIAAGNDGADLSLNADAPIEWSMVPPFDQNLIGVGAADSSKHPLGLWRDSSGTQHPGSNWGRDFVQLLADGQDVASAADDNSYGFDTGTSEAAPQISAAAVLLEAAGVREPNRIKARLITTADWDPTYQDFVSGGYLNVTAAAWMPARAALATQSEPGVRRFVNDLKTPGVNDRITVEEGTCKRTNTWPCNVPGELRFETILRIQRIAGDENRFRVWYVEPEFKYLTVLDGVLLSGNMQFTGSQVWSAEQKKLILWDREMVTLGVEQISDYIAGEARIPRDIKF